MEKSGFESEDGYVPPFSAPAVIPPGDEWKYSFIAGPSLAADPVPEDTYSSDSFGSDSYGSDSFGAGSFATDSFASDSFNADSFNADSFNADSVALDDAYRTESLLIDNFAGQLDGVQLDPPAFDLPAQPAAPPSPWLLDPESAPEPVAPVVRAALVAEAEAEEAAYQRTTTEAPKQNDDISLQELLIEMLERGASDLHLTSNAPPTIRVNGSLQPVMDQPVLTAPVLQRAIYAVLTQRQREKFEEELELDFAYSVPGRARFRVNLYRQRDAVGAAFRVIPVEIKKLEELGIPETVANFAKLARGFVLVTGPTGSGKSTTLAALIDLANRTRAEHIMTVEDPIEFLHRHQKCIINQREVGEDTKSFAQALKHVLRQDPDIILVGEMRDLETISVALTAAETGHLVFATLHTSDAAQTIDRIIDVFPPHQQQQVRVQLASSLQGVVCQTLAKTTDGTGRAVATEVLVATPAVRNLIREGKTHQIYSAMQAGAKHGMHTMDQHLADLVKAGRIKHDTGAEKCHNIEDFNRLTGRG